MKEKMLKILEEGKKYGYSNEAIAGVRLTIWRYETAGIKCETLSAETNDE
jgi:hypothetical protein